VSERWRRVHRLISNHQHQNLRDEVVVLLAKPDRNERGTGSSSRGAAPSQMTGSRTELMEPLAAVSTRPRLPGSRSFLSGFRQQVPTNLVAGRFWC